LLAAGQLVEARQLVDTLRRALPGNSNGLALEGDLAIADNDFQKAIDIFSKLQQLYPDSGQWVVKLAQAQLSVGEADAALATYQRWLAARPDDSRIQRELADTYLKLGQNEAAGTCMPDYWSSSLNRLTYCSSWPGRCGRAIWPGRKPMPSRRSSNNRNLHWPKGLWPSSSWRQARGNRLLPY